MKTTYRVVRERLFCRELGSYDSYGICAVSPDGDTAYIPDISTTEFRVTALAERLNRLAASLTHFMDLVLDSMD